MNILCHAILFSVSITRHHKNLDFFVVIMENHLSLVAASIQTEQQPELSLEQQLELQT